MYTRAIFDTAGLPWGAVDDLFYFCRGAAFGARQQHVAAHIPMLLRHADLWPRAYKDKSIDFYAEPDSATTAGILTCESSARNVALFVFVW